MSFEDTVFAADSNDDKTEDEPDTDLTDRVRNLILDHTDIQQDEIDELVDDIIELYNGIVSKTAALYLLARQEGIQPNQELGHEPNPELEIQNVIPDINDLTIEVTVDTVQDTNTFEKDGEQNRVRNVVVKDETGRTQLTLWGSDTEVADQLNPGDQLQIEGGYTSESDWCEKRYGCPAELRIGDGVLILVSEEGQERLV